MFYASAVDKKTIRNNFIHKTNIRCVRRRRLNLDYKFKLHYSICNDNGQGKMGKLKKNIAVQTFHGRWIVVIIFLLLCFLITNNIG